MRNKLLLPAALAVSAAAIWFLWILPRRADTAQPPPAPAAPATSVASLGHFEPENGIVKIAAPFYGARPSLVGRLLVKEGDLLRPGQTIAVLDGFAQAIADTRRAEAAVELARRKVEQVRAGAKDSDVRAQRAEIQRLTAALALDDANLKRYQQLFDAGVTAASDLDVRRTAVETSRRALETAQHRLAALNEFRDPDLRVAELDLRVAETQLVQSQTLLDSLTIRSPAKGRVLKLNARAGEEVGSGGILEMADTTRMNVEAEVYAGDLARVHPGQTAAIEPEGTDAKMTGTVTYIGAMVQKGAVLPNDPASYSDARVVPVKIRVPACASAPCPIHARVKVVIDAR
jgi:HlyD family secretion protein